MRASLLPLTLLVTLCGNMPSQGGTYEFHPGSTLKLGGTFDPERPTSCASAGRAGAHAPAGEHLGGQLIVDRAN